LRDFWLKSANQEKVNRESPKFDYKAALDKYQSIRGVAENSNTGRVAQASTKGRFKK
jgi:hypothetical protein